jgi:predicted Ser/Thr protein kinase
LDSSPLPLICSAEASLPLFLENPFSGIPTVKDMYFTRNNSTTETRYQVILEAAGIPPATPKSRYAWTLHSDGHWLVVRDPEIVSPDQGWKLHISAHIYSAEAVLERVLPVLIAAQACFKVASSPQQLIKLNQGEGGLSQVGKFMTVYPLDEAQSVTLAVGLDEATRGLSGPIVATDRPLTLGSLIHYRYGGFSGTTYFQTPMGLLQASIITPDGDVVPDRRALMYLPPAWAEDPFEKAGVAQPLPKRSSLINKRYLPMTTLHRSARSTVYLAFDILGGKGCVLKEVSHEVSLRTGHIPTSEGLRQEAKILQILAPDSRFPTLFDSFEENGYLYLVMEDVVGKTIETVVAEYRNQCTRVPQHLMLRWAIELADILDYIHAKGYVYRDLKSANVIVAPDGHLRLIDFDLTTLIRTMPLSPGSGTQGYMSPQQSANGSASLADDIYSFGALLYLFATGAESSRAPTLTDLFSRHPLLLNPVLDESIVEVMKICLAADPAQRYATITELKAVLQTIHGSEVDRIPDIGNSRVVVPDGSYYRLRAEALGETLLKTALPRLNGEGLLWLSQHGTAAGMYSRDINSGTGGALLAVLEMATATDDPRYAEAARKGAKWLMVAPVPKGSVVPGLYVGESGRVLLYWRTGEHLNDDHWRDVADHHSHRVAELPHECPDIFNGSAGRLRTHLRLWQRGQSSVQLKYARTAGRAILNTATVEPNGDTYWTIPQGFDSLSGHTYLGYAHGAAGIADALLDLYKIDDSSHLQQAIGGTAAWLQRHAMPTPFDPQGVAWGNEVGHAISPSFWCHGGTGIGHFFLRAGLAGIVPDGIEWAERAAHGMIWGTRWSTPPQCHGLAGNIDFLLNLYLVTGNAQYYREALNFGALLDAFGIEKEGNLAWSSESPTVFTPDYMVGFAGVVTTLLRLADPKLPHPLHPLY